ncbi:hypothetical protein [Cerasicoccus maritimus]|uniref:hypothetical protein n=1 Tax=Cerasicoccus maritimus TaxID=490089 RepID=UPI0028525BE0|nr:hypothetical protein [Cerasicoccus maritimus]
MLTKSLHATTLYLFSGLTLFAQDGQPASSAASAAPEEPFKVNTEAWDSFISFNGDRILGDPSQHQFTPSVTYYTSYTTAGKRIARDSIMPSIATSGPLFGGDGYGAFTGVIPFDSQYTNQFNAVGGWKYNLTEYIDVDVGGGFALYDKNSFGEGQPSALGSWYRSEFYFGLIGDFLLHPAAYIVYDSNLEQVEGVIGVSQRWELAQEVYFFWEGRLGYLNANSYFGYDGPAGVGKWQNGYAYWLTAVEVSWEVIKNGTIAIGGGYAGNNDGTIGLRSIDMGPENTFYGKVSISYSF